jgi:hypothetical protein
MIVSQESESHISSNRNLAYVRACNFYEFNALDGELFGLQIYLNLKKIW